MVSEILEISATGGTDGLGYVLMRNCPDCDPFRVIAATLRIMVRQRVTGDEDIAVMRAALEKLERGTSTEAA